MKRNKEELGERMNKIPVLITTDSTKKGVFMGFINPEDADKDTFVAEEIRMAVYWAADVRGVLGLASNGPTADCKISPAVIRGVLKGVTATMEISDKALKAWRSEPWAK